MLNTPRMRAAAVDLGKVRVGLAVADELGLMAIHASIWMVATRAGVVG